EVRNGEGGGEDGAGGGEEAADLPWPGLGAGARVERVRVPARGADLHRRRRVRRVGDRRRRVDVVAGRVRPRDLPGPLVEAVHAAVRVTRVHAPERDRGRGVEAPLDSEAPAKAGLAPLDR